MTTARAYDRNKKGKKDEKPAGRVLDLVLFPRRLDLVYLPVD